MENLRLPHKAKYYSYQVDVSKREIVKEMANQVKKDVGKVIARIGSSLLQSFLFYFFRSFIQLNSIMLLHYYDDD